MHKRGEWCISFQSLHLLKSCYLYLDPDLWLTVVFSVGILHDKSFHVFIVAAEMEGGQLGELYKCGY